MFNDQPQFANVMGNWSSMRKLRSDKACFQTSILKCQLLSHVQLFVTPWAVAHQAPLSMEFSRQEYWSGLPFPFPGDLPDPGIKPGSLTLEADSWLSEPLGKSASTQIPILISFGGVERTIVKKEWEVGVLDSQVPRANKLKYQWLPALYQGWVSPVLECQ